MTILTEKDSVAKNIAQALKMTKTKSGLYESSDKKIKMTYAAGHLYTLYDFADYDPNLKSWYNTKYLPFVPQIYKTKADDGFKNVKRKTRLECEEVLRNAIKTHDEILIATDPDREGEVIARFILDKLKADYSKVTRLWCCEGVNEEEVIKAIKERKSASYYNDLYKKGYAQKKSDWVMGLNLTRLFTVLMNDSSVWSIGRVQSAVMQEIYDREMSINLFIPQDYYEIKVKCTDGSIFYVNKEVNNNQLYTDKDEINAIKEKLQKGSKIRVSNVKTVHEEKKAPQLYDSSSLLSDLYDLYGIDVDKSLNIVQTLYNIKGVVSYPRTASRYLKEEDYPYISDLYDKLKNIKALDSCHIKNEKRIFDTKKCVGHHAIIPSKKYESSDEDGKVYDVILTRFLMQGMDNFITERTKCNGYANGVNLTASGTNVINEGWRKIDKRKKEVLIPLNVKEGEEKEIEECEILNKKTEPPKYYNQASLITWMKNPGGKDEEGEEIIGIGTQATQANIIKTLFDRKYIQNKGKHIEITERGIKLVDTIRDIPLLDKNTRVETTTMWEKMNEKDPDEFLKKIEEETKKIFKSEEDKLQTAVEKKEVGICPSCGSKILGGKNGWYCEGYKEKGCENSLTYHLMGNDINEEFMKKLLQEKKSPLMKGVKKDGSECTFKVVINDEGKFILNFSDSVDKVCECPLCKSMVITLNKVYKCSNKECSFFLWKKTSGIEITKEDARKLINKEEVLTIQEKKDGSKAKVRIKLDDNFEKVIISYQNGK